MSSLPPAIIMLAGALAVLVLPSRVRPWVLIAAPALVMAQLRWWLPLGSEVELEWVGLDLTPLRVGQYNQVFGSIFGIVGVIGGVYAFHMRDRGQQAAVLLYAAGAEGVVFAGDLLTLVVAWEIMAVASAFLIFGGGRPQSVRAGQRYLFVHVIGGSLLLGGILWHLAEQSVSLAFTGFEGGVAAWLILLGVAVNAAIPPLHAWLPDAYPEASSTGMIFLGAFTTKAAVFVLLRGFDGWDILAPAGIVMALYGIVYALMENDIRRLLAYHLISQIGFMVTAIGIGTEHALDGATAHAFNNLVYTTLLLMGAGAILEATGRTKLTELGGLARPMRWVLVLYMIGALSISVFPAFAGFVSSEHASTGQVWIGFWLWVASVGTFLHVGLKLPYFAFFHAARDVPVRAIPSNMYVAMAMAAGLSLVIGLIPDSLYSIFDFAVHPEGYSLANIVHTLELVGFTAIGFILTRSLLSNDSAISLDSDWFYRKAATPVRVLIQQPLEWVFSLAQRGVDWVVRVATRMATRPEAGWATVLAWTRVGRRDGPTVAVSLLGRPPLSAAVAVIWVTFAVVVLVVSLR